MGGGWGLNFWVVFVDFLETDCIDCFCNIFGGLQVWGKLSKRMTVGDQEEICMLSLRVAAFNDLTHFEDETLPSTNSSQYSTGTFYNKGRTS